MRISYSDRQQKQIINEWVKFYSITTPEELAKIHSNIFDAKKDYNARQLVYKKYGNKLEKLKPIFKSIVREQNKFAQNLGFPSWMEWSMHQKGVTSEQIEFFVNNVDKVIEKLYKNVPQINEVPSWWWTKYALPHCHSHVKTPEYQMPDEIIKLVEDMEPAFQKYFSKIKIEHGERQSFPYCEFIREDKTCLIKANLKATCFYERLSLVHELGHAFDFLTDVKKGKDPMKKSHYRREFFALQFEQKFVDNYLHGTIRDAVNGRVLEDLVLALFEYDIYKNPDKDFDKLYAQAHNRVFAISKQKQNPFYLVRDTVIMRPGAMIETGIIDVELFIAS